MGRQCRRPAPNQPVCFVLTAVSIRAPPQLPLRAIRPTMGEIPRHLWAGAGRGPPQHVVCTDGHCPLARRWFPRASDPRSSPVKASQVSAYQSPDNPMWRMSSSCGHEHPLGPSLVPAGSCCGLHCTSTMGIGLLMAGQGGHGQRGPPALGVLGVATITG